MEPGFTPHRLFDAFVRLYGTICTDLHENLKFGAMFPIEVEYTGVGEEGVDYTNR